MAQDQARIGGTTRGVGIPSPSCGKPTAPPLSYPIDVSRNRLHRAPGQQFARLSQHGVGLCANQFGLVSLAP